MASGNQSVKLKEEGRFVCESLRPRVPAGTPLRAADGQDMTVVENSHYFAALFLQECLPDVGALCPPRRKPIF